MTSAVFTQILYPPNRRGKGLSHIVIGVIIAFYLSDVVNTILWNVQGAPPKFSIYIRTAFELFALACIFSSRRITKTKLKITIGWALGILLAIFGELAFQLNCPHANFVEAFYSINKFLFVYLIFYVFSYSFNAAGSNGNKWIYKIYECIIYVNAICPILGLAFGIKLFDSYLGTRFGYKGFIPIANDASMFWIIALFYSMVVWRTEKRKLPLLVSLIASMLVGTKALWLLTPLAMFVFTWKFYPKYGKALCLVIALALLYLIKFHLMDFLFLLREKNGFQSIIEPIATFLQGGDAMPSLSSGRYAVGGKSLSDNFYLNLAYWDSFNYLFGGAYIGTEMDVYDVFATFGVVGTAILLYGFCVIFSNIHSSFRLYFAVFIVALAILGGHVVQNAGNMTYLCLFVLRASRNQIFIFNKRSALCLS